MEKDSAVAMIKNCGHHCKDAFEAATPDIQEWLWRDVSKLVISIVKGIDCVEQ